jgi:predicted RNA binding protein YcfA (HicA-like mRNA interferase family)
MPKKVGELKALLRKAGFERKRIKGSHERWVHPMLPELPVTLAGKDSKDAKVYQERLIQSALRRLKEKREDQ